MSYSKIGTTVASYLGKELNMDDESVTIIAYAVDSFLLGMGGFALILLFGSVLGNPLLALDAGLSGGGLRRLSGGMHLNSPKYCLVSGSIVYSMLGYISRVVQISGMNRMLMIACSLLLICLFAPVDSKAKPIISPKFRKRLKVLSILFVLACLCVVLLLTSEECASAISLGVLFQSLTLVPFLNRR